MGPFNNGQVIIVLINRIFCYRVLKHEIEEANRDSMTSF